MAGDRGAPAACAGGGKGGFIALALCFLTLATKKLVQYAMLCLLIVAGFASLHVPYISA